MGYPEELTCHAGVVEQRVGRGGVIDHEFTGVQYCFSVALHDHAGPAQLHVEEDAGLQVVTRQLRCALDPERRGPPWAHSQTTYVGDDRAHVDGPWLSGPVQFHGHHRLRKCLVYKLSTVAFVDNTGIQDERHTRPLTLAVNLAWQRAPADVGVPGDRDDSAGWMDIRGQNEAQGAGRRLTATTQRAAGSHPTPRREALPAEPFADARGLIAGSV